MLGLGGRQADAAVLTRMARSIAHRGPDDSGLYLDRQVGFGFRRLAILDLSPTGHQPMCSEDGEFVIVFNGEIYNYIELREELRAAGYRFRSTSDTEVLLAAYRQWGPDCLGRLNGMWAFVIHDRRRGVLFGARDRFGVKPLFVHRGKEYWLLASEAKAEEVSSSANIPASHNIPNRIILSSIIYIVAVGEAPGRDKAFPTSSGTY